MGRLMWPLVLFVACVPLIASCDSEKTVSAPVTTQATLDTTSATWAPPAVAPTTSTPTTISVSNPAAAVCIAFITAADIWIQSASRAIVAESVQARAKADVATTGIQRWTDALNASSAALSKATYASEVMLAFRPPCRRGLSPSCDALPTAVDAMLVKFGEIYPAVAAGSYDAAAHIADRTTWGGTVLAYRNTSAACRGS
jgi:hypothetical protein